MNKELVCSQLDQILDKMERIPEEIVPTITSDGWFEASKFYVDEYTDEIIDELVEKTGISKEQLREYISNPDFTTNPMFKDERIAGLFQYLYFSPQMIMTYVRDYKYNEPPKNGPTRAQIRVAPDWPESVKEKIAELNDDPDYPDYYLEKIAIKVVVTLKKRKYGDTYVVQEDIDYVPTVIYTSLYEECLQQVRKAFMDSYANAKTPEERDALDNLCEKQAMILFKERLYREFGIGSPAIVGQKNNRSIVTSLDDSKDNKKIVKSWAHYVEDYEKNNGIKLPEVSDKGYSNWFVSGVEVYDNRPLNETISMHRNKSITDVFDLKEEQKENLNNESQNSQRSTEDFLRDFSERMDAIYNNYKNATAELKERADRETKDILARFETNRAKQTEKIKNEFNTYISDKRNEINAGFDKIETDLEKVINEEILDSNQEVPRFDTMVVAKKGVRDYRICSSNLTECEEQLLKSYPGFYSDCFELLYNAQNPNEPWSTKPSLIGKNNIVLITLSDNLQYTARLVNYGDYPALELIKVHDYGEYRVAYDLFCNNENLGFSAGNFDHHGYKENPQFQVEYSVSQPHHDMMDKEARLNFGPKGTKKFACNALSDYGKCSKFYAEEAQSYFDKMLKGIEKFHTELNLSENSFVEEGTDLENKLR